jgi:CubicO group peptidase (beta-lactamase class C family)
LDRRVDVLEYDAVIRALETQKPLWPSGTAHGYHARTFGFLLDELVRRIAGKTLSDYWQETFARPLNLDFWIGLPEKENSRVATMGIDRVFKIPTAFSAGFMKDSARAQGTAVSSPPNPGKGRIGNRPSLGTPRLFGPSQNSFGHPGAGGSHAFCDPENRIAFAYVMNQMEQSLLPTEKSLRLANAIYSYRRLTPSPVRSAR